MLAQMHDRPPFVRFKYGLKERRDERGTPLYDEVAFALITPAGTKDVVEREADAWIAEMTFKVREGVYNPQWLEHFKAAYGAWKDGNELPVNGTPIRTWPVLSPGEVQRCLDAKITTVEDLAAANEGVLTMLGMGSRSMKDRATAWISQKQDANLTNENAALKVRLEESERQIAELRQAVSELAPKERKRAA